MDDVVIKLTPDEALVLFEWLSRMEDTGALDPLVQHWAEQRVVWAVHGQLQKTLTQPFRPDYADLLNAARERLVEGLDEGERKRAR